MPNYAQHPVLVVAGDTVIGLTVMRCLGRHGVPAYCAISRPDAVGPRSAYCRGSFRLPKESDEAAVASIIEHARRWKVTRLIGISERHIVLLNRYRAELEREFTLLFPPQPVFERVIYKNTTLDFARRVGVPVPETASPQRPEEIDQCRRLTFPVILKMAHHEFPPGTEVVFQHKSLRVETFDELEKVLTALPPGQYPLVQEYIPGTGAGMSILMREGRAVLAFQHRRIRESPPQGGIGVLCEALPPDSRLLAHSEKLLQAMDWDGVAMVEYRGVWPDGRFALMEINGRFWGSLPTAIHAGAEFPFWLYATSFPNAPAPPRQYRTPLRVRSLAGDTKWLLAVLRGRLVPPGKALLDYFASFHPSTRYFIWAWDDPLPSIGNLLERLRRR